MVLDYNPPRDDFISHLKDDNSVGTACGEPWQGWQAPKDLDLKDPEAIILPPHDQPRPHKDRIRFCGACRKIGLNV